MTDHLWTLVVLIVVALTVALALMWVNIKSRGTLARLLSFIGMWAALVVVAIGFVKFAVDVL